MPAQNFTFADLTFDDITSSKTFTFTNPGPTGIDILPGCRARRSITLWTQPVLYLQHSGSFRKLALTCGTDCDNWMLIDDGDPNLTYVEVTGSIVPAPELYDWLCWEQASSLFATRRWFLTDDQS